VDVYDPWTSAEVVKKEYGISLSKDLEKGAYDAIIVAVSHRQFKEMGESAIRALGKPQHILYDLKYVLPLGASDLRL
ncbi:MAG TPA: Vi polysaccharide biosynthesis protein VipA/TviB, partial [Chitinophagaceae bacterium]|nr:Vi polysaccharide biosynthesis protein VipA/TviB [Chitinophagaceae bacterium]